MLGISVVIHNNMTLAYIDLKLLKLGEALEARRRKWFTMVSTWNVKLIIFKCVSKLTKLTVIKVHPVIPYSSSYVCVCVFAYVHKFEMLQLILLFFKMFK